VTKEELIDRLNKGAEDHDPERGHADCDDALLEYIDDPDVTAAFNTGFKWYA
jgi:hypothetical protein